jgi:hypothetical protein
MFFRYVIILILFMANEVIDSQVEGKASFKLAAPAPVAPAVPLATVVDDADEAGEAIVVAIFALMGFIYTQLKQG